MIRIIPKFCKIDNIPDEEKIIERKDHMDGFRIRPYLPALPKIMD
jgi:hypothetical protein